MIRNSTTDADASLESTVISFRLKSQRGVEVLTVFFVASSYFSLSIGSKLMLILGIANTMMRQNTYVSKRPTDRVSSG